MKAYKNDTLIPPPTPEEKAAEGKASVVNGENGGNGDVVAGGASGEREEAADPPTPGGEGDADPAGTPETNSALSTREGETVDATGTTGSGLTRRVRGRKKDTEAGGSTKNGDNQGADENSGKGGEHVEPKGVHHGGKEDGAAAKDSGRNKGVPHPGRLPINIYDNGFLLVSGVRQLLGLLVSVLVHDRLRCRLRLSSTE